MKIAMKQCICQDNVGDMLGVIVLWVNNLSHTILMAKRLSHGKSLVTIKLVDGACTFGAKNLAKQMDLVDVQVLACKIVHSAIRKLDSLGNLKNHHQFGHQHGTMGGAHHHTKDKQCLFH